MAQKVTHIEVCDYCPEEEVTEGVETFTFPSTRGTVQAEGCPDHRKAVEEIIADLDGYAALARPVTAGATHRRRDSRSKAHRQASGDVRAWAKQRGHQVSDKGRIPAAIQAEYDATH